MTDEAGTRPPRWMAWVGIVLLVQSLAGCVSATRLVRNENASDEVKRKGVAAYKEILLIPPKDDKREVVPRVVREFEAMGFTVRVMNPDKPLEAGQGTGFLISADGHLLTCAHVLGEEKTATVFLQGQRFHADVVGKDKDVDLALLKLRAPAPAAARPLAFRTDTPYSMGEDVFTIGYPLSRLLGNSARMSRGLLAATTGARDDARRVQVSAEIQPGNSGSPLLSRDGQVIGVVQTSLNPWRIARSTGGALPQNVNFSIKNDPALAFISGVDATARAALTLNRPGTLEAAQHGVAKVLAGQVSEDKDDRSVMVVSLTYVSIWDLWYRFRLFVLSAYDFDTQESLFAVGQGRDNMVSTEDVVIRDTLARFRQAVGR